MVLLLLLLLLDPLLSMAEGVSRLTLVRPFAPRDHAKLPASFDKWNTELPCDTGAVGTTVETDLILCYSQSLGKDSAASDSVQTILNAFAQSSDAWHSCFANVFAVSAELLPSQDAYITTSTTGGNTASGPNFQFIRIAENLRNGTWGRGAYDVFMVMEMDTRPVRSRWLDGMIEDLDANAPFVVYGSNYRGSRWDHFFATLAPSLRYHINGNALYNYTSPHFSTLLANVSAEAKLGHHEVAYDLLMAEYILEHRQVDWDLFELYKPAATFISNYVGMILVPNFVGDEYLIHGGQMGRELDPTDTSIALVVSDWGNQAELAGLLDALRTGYHPFREVIVFWPSPGSNASAEDIHVDGDKIGTFTLQYIQRGGAASMDWCNAQVQSDWVAYTNIYFSVRQPTRLVQSADGRPMVHYLSPQQCSQFPECQASRERASRFAGSFGGSAYEGHFDLHQMVFRSDTRTAFCAAWEDWYGSEDRGCDPILGPTADDYMAWLGSNGGVEEMYALYDRSVYDAPGFAVQRQAPPVDNRPCSLYTAVQRNDLLNNFTNCSLLVTEAECTAAGALDCVWRASVGSCYEHIDITPPLTVQVRGAGVCGQELVVGNAITKPVSVDIQVSDELDTDMQEAFTLLAADTRVVPVKFASRSTQGRVTVTGTGPLKTWRKTVAVSGCPSPAPVAAEVVAVDACGGSVRFSAPKLRVTNQIDKAVNVAVTVSAELDGAGAADAIALGAGESTVIPMKFVGDSASGHVTVAARPEAWTGEWWSTVVAVSQVDLRPLLFYTNMYYTDDEIFVTDQRAWQLRVAVSNRLRFTFPSAAAGLIPDGVVPALEADPDEPGFYRAKDTHAGHHVTVKKSLIPLLNNANMQVTISGT